jgi:hypothetical protein
MLRLGPSSDTLILDDLPSLLVLLRVFVRHFYSEDKTKGGDSSHEKLYLLIDILSASTGGNLGRRFCFKFYYSN